MTTSQLELETGKNDLKIKYLAAEQEAKKELMEQEYIMNYSLKKLETQNLLSREVEREDRKDSRTKIQASQQSEMIDQRLKNKPPKNFEGASNSSFEGLPF